MKTLKLCSFVALLLLLCLAFRPNHLASADDAVVAFAAPDQIVFLTIEPLLVMADSVNEVELNVTWHNPTREDVYIAHVLGDFGTFDLVRRTIAFPKMAV